MPEGSDTAHQALQITSGLVSKVYVTAGQAGASLHNMLVLQAYQAALLIDLDEGKGILRW